MLKGISTMEGWWVVSGLRRKKRNVATKWKLTVTVFTKEKKHPAQTSAGVITCSHSYTNRTVSDGAGTDSKLCKNGTKWGRNGREMPVC